MRKPKQGHKFTPTARDRMQVKKLAGLGFKEDDISSLMEVSPPTLRKYFSAELSAGHVEATSKVAQSLFDMATDKVKPNVAAAIFWMKCRGQWRENNEGGKKDAAMDAAQSASRGEYASAPVPLRAVK